MKLLNKIYNYCGVGLLIGATATVTLNSCTENIDDSDLYTFTGEMIVDRFANKPDTYSSYLTLLEKVHPSKRSASTMKELLSARGNYTVFAPTNEAIAYFLDSLYHMEVPEVSSTNIEEIPDSVAESIVFNSIIENGNEPAFGVTDFEEGALGRTNMKDRYVSISYANDSNSNTLIYVNVNSRIIESTMEEEIANGYIHTVDRVLSPSNATIADLIMTTENLTLFGNILSITGWDKQLLRYRDEAYEENEAYDDLRGLEYTFNNWTGKYPAHRYYGHTVFVETDSVYAANGITDIASLKQWVKEHAYYDDDTNRGHITSWDDDYTSPYNWLNQFVAYHLLPETLTYNNMVTFANEYGCDAATMKTRTPNSFYVNVWEYWETLGVQRRSIKITGIRGQKRINRVSVYNKFNYKERMSEMTQMGILINANNGEYNNNALNGYYYTIDDILIWSEDVPNKVLNERLRYDVTSLYPELLTNNIRQNRNNSDCANGYWFFTKDYIDNVVAMTDATEFIYLPNQGYSGAEGSWMNYQIDEFNIQGIFDFTMKLPPVPYTGTYELRYGINANNNRGMAQVYLGKNPNNLPAIGIPLDLRSNSGTSTTATGWIADATLDPTDGDPHTSEAINENDKSMRNIGFMKAPKYIQLASSKEGRDCNQCLRKIIYTGQLEAGETYYIRFKSVLSGNTYEFFFDYLELVPKAIYAGDEAEDKW